jgi:hypothetical protein
MLAILIIGAFVSCLLLVCVLFGNDKQPIEHQLDQMETDFTTDRKYLNHDAA